MGADDTVLAEASSDRGMLRVEAGGFEAALLELIGSWLASSRTILVLAVSCNTNPPNEIVGGTEFGEVYVSSNVAGAEIHVDGENSGFVTPDTLTLPAGSHDIDCW